MTPKLIELEVRAHILGRRFLSRDQHEQNSSIDLETFTGNLPGLNTILGLGNIAVNKIYRICWHGAYILMWGDSELLNNQLISISDECYKENENRAMVLTGGDESLCVEGE